MVTSSGPKTTDLGERYRVLLDIGRTITGTLGTDELFRVIYRETARVVEATGFYIAVYDPDSDLATIVFYADQGEERRVEIQYRGSESSVIRDGEPTIINEGVQAHSLMVLGDQESEITRSAISVPLKFQGHVMGAISAQSYQPHAYDAADQELLQGIADLAAVAIENARHVQELEARRREAERIEAIGLAMSSSLDARAVIRQIVDAALELLEADAAHLWLVERERATVAASGGPLALPEGSRYSFPDEVLEDVAALGRPILIPEVGESPLIPEAMRRELQETCGMLVPLLLGEQVSGFLSVGHREHRTFSDDEVQAAKRLASQASAALVNARLHERVQALSLTDPLTGLPNRRHLQMHLQRELAAARRGRALTVVIFDLDRFKTYNDTHGHVAGDEALRHVGMVLTREARAMNVVARYGGDEFISVLAGSTMEEGHMHAERIAIAVSQDPYLSEHGMTVSYGLGAYDRDMTTIDDIIRTADRDLYDRKAARPKQPAG